MLVQSWISVIYASSSTFLSSAFNNLLHTELFISVIIFFALPNFGLLFLLLSFVQPQPHSVLPQLSRSVLRVVTASLTPPHEDGFIANDQPSQGL